MLCYILAGFSCYMLIYTPCLFTLWRQIDKQELPPDAPTVSASSSSHSQTNTPPPRQATPTSSFDRVTPSNSDTQVTKPVHPVQPTVKSGTYNTQQSGSGSYTQPQVYSRSSDQQGICTHFYVADQVWCLWLCLAPLLNNWTHETSQEIGNTNCRQGTKFDTVISCLLLGQTIIFLSEKRKEFFNKLLSRDILQHRERGLRLFIDFAISSRSILTTLFEIWEKRWMHHVEVMK